MHFDCKPQKGCWTVGGFHFIQFPRDAAYERKIQTRVLHGLGTFGRAPYIWYFWLCLRSTFKNKISSRSMIPAKHWINFVKMRCIFSLYIDLSLPDIAQTTPISTSWSQESKVPQLRPSQSNRDFFTYKNRMYQSFARFYFIHSCYMGNMNAL